MTLVELLNFIILDLRPKPIKIIEVLNTIQHLNLLTLMQIKVKCLKDKTEIQAHRNLKCLFITPSNIVELKRILRNNSWIQHKDL